MRSGCHGLRECGVHSAVKREADFTPSGSFSRTPRMRIQRRTRRLASGANLPTRFPGPSGNRMHATVCPIAFAMEAAHAATPGLPPGLNFDAGGCRRVVKQQVH